MKDINVSINKERLLHNIASIKSFMPKNCKICAVVKSDAYGHGITNFCKIIDNYIDCYAVANNHEAYYLHKKTNKKILVLGKTSPFYLKSAIKNDIILSVDSINELDLIENIAKKMNKLTFVHIKVNTGMNRQGLETKKDLKNFLEKFSNYPHIKISGIFSHIGCIENKKRTTKQILKFNEFLSVSPKNLTKHLYNSVFYKNNKDCFDLVRTGIALYGYDFPNVLPCLQIDAKIIAIKHLKKGDYIGYGYQHRAKKDMQIAVLNIGYGKGLPRLLSNKGYVLIQGQKCKFCANICMDMSIVDITNLKVNIFDSATILGINNGYEITAYDIAKICKTIPYEILTNFKKIA